MSVSCSKPNIVNIDVERNLDFVTSYFILSLYFLKSLKNHMFQNILNLSLGY